MLAKLWADGGHDAAALASVDLTGAEPVLPSSFAVGSALQASVAAATLAAAEIWRERSGRRQRVGGFGFDEVRRAMRENGREEPHGSETDDTGDPSGVS